MFISRKNLYLVSMGLLASFSLLLIIGDGYAAKRDKKSDSFVMTEAELQSRVMGFADQFASIIVTAFEIYDAQAPLPQNRRIVQSDIAHSMASAYTIAAEIDPDTALLDMVVMVTLGRIVYEDFYQKKWGSEIHPIFYGFRKAEVDIWKIASTILQSEKQQELSTLIREWRKNYPNINRFSHVRFSDFAAERRKSRLSRSKKDGGIFKSVELATQQVEETRLLAERGMFLATRLPLLTGFFADTWLSKFAINPDVSRMLSDFHQFSAVSERLANFTEGFSDNIANERQQAIRQVMKEVDTLSQTTIDRVMTKVEIEREAAIKQLVEEISNERENIIQDFIVEEERIRGVLTQLKQTLSTGNDLLVTTNSLLEKFDVGVPSDTPSRPFDIRDYRDTVTEVSNTAQKLTTLVNSTNQLVGTVGIDQLLPKIVEAIDKVEDEGRNIIDHSFRQAVFLIIIWMVGYVLARVIIHHVTKRRVQTVVDTQT